MSHVNLLPKSTLQKRQRYLRNYYAVLTGGILLAGVLVLTVLLLLFDQIYRLNLSSAQAERAQAQSTAAGYLNTEKQATDLAKQLNTLKQAQGQSTRWAMLLTDLQSVTPAGVSVKQIDVQGAEATGTPGAAAAITKATLSGAADSRRSAAAFQVALASRPSFKNVELNTTTKGDAVIEYKITFDANFDKLKGSTK